MKTSRSAKLLGYFEPLLSLEVEFETTSISGLTVHRYHMPREADAALINVIYERRDFPSGSYYEIFWYHWPRDGLFWWEDYEPIVFAYNSKHESCFVFIRRAWKPLIYNPDEVFRPPEVLFVSQYHHPYIKRANGQFGAFEISNDYVTRVVNSSFPKLDTSQSSIRAIPEWNISGLGENIYDELAKAISESCG